MKAIDQITELRKGYSYVETAAYHLVDNPNKQYLKESREKYWQCMEHLSSFNFGDFFSTVELETAQLTPAQKQTYKADLFASLIGYDCYMSGKKDSVFHPFMTVLNQLMEQKDRFDKITPCENKTYLQMCWDRVDILEKWVLAGVDELAIQAINIPGKETANGVKMKIGKLIPEVAERLYQLCIYYNVFDKKISPDEFCQGFRCTIQGEQPLCIKTKDSFITLYNNSDNIFATKEQQEGFFSSFGIDIPKLAKRAGQKGDSQRQIDFAQKLQAIK